MIASNPRGLAQMERVAGYDRYNPRPLIHPSHRDCLCRFLRKSDGRVLCFLAVTCSCSFIQFYDTKLQNPPGRMVPAALSDYNDEVNGSNQANSSHAGLARRTVISCALSDLQLRSPSARSGADGFSR